MKQFLLLSVFFFIAFSSFSQKKAVTETGQEVILFENGTWEYANDSVNKETEIRTNPLPFKRSITSTFLLKSTKLNIAVWLNPKKWVFKKGNEDETAELDFTLKGKDLYGMIITENIEVPIESLKNIAFDNAKDVAPDIKIVNEEYRMVNNLKVLFMQMNGTMQGVKFTYYGYYFSNEKGSMQFITYTAQNLLKEYQAEMEELLNGLIETE